MNRRDFLKTATANGLVLAGTIYNKNSYSHEMGLFIPTKDGFSENNVIYGTVPEEGAELTHFGFVSHGKIAMSTYEGKQAKKAYEKNDEAKMYEFQVIASERAIGAIEEHGDSHQYDFLAKSEGFRGSNVDDIFKSVPEELYEKSLSQIISKYDVTNEIIENNPDLGKSLTSLLGR